MLSMQHILCTKLHEQDDLNINDYATYMGAVLFPDAIRAYSGLRQYSHFEKGSDGVHDTSWWQFPTSMKCLTKEKIQNHLSVFAHKSSSIRPCAIGEDTDIHAFYEHNQHLPADMFLGIENHLKQDIEFDKFIRSHIDCTDKYDDVFRFHGTVYNGKDIRGVITSIENHGIYVLAHELYEREGITANQKWFADNIQPLLHDVYSDELADKTFSFMNMTRSVDTLISSHDWSYLDKGVLPYRDYQELYSDVLHSMSDSFVKNPEEPGVEYE